MDGMAPVGFAIGFFGGFYVMANNGVHPMLTMILSLLVGLFLARLLGGDS